MKPYVISSLRGGVSDEDNRGIKGSFKYGNHLNIHKRRDSLSCNQKMVTIGGGTVVDLVNFFVAGSDGSTYAFGDAGKIYGISDEHGVALKTTDTNGAIKGAEQWGLDSGLSYLFWCTDTALSRKLMPGNDAWGDETLAWKNDLITSQTWHALKRAAANLMMCNGNYLALLDYEGIWNPQAMNIEPENILNCLESRGDFVIMGSSPRGGAAEEGYLWSWIPTATNYVNKKKLPIKGVQALIDAELMLASGGADGEVFFSDFSNTEPQIAVPDGGSIAPGAVNIENDLALFGFYGGTYPGLWSYGRRAKNRPVILNQEYRLVSEIAGSTVSKIGAIGSNNGVIYASWKIVDGSTTTYGIDCVSTTTKATAVYESLEFDAGAPYLRKQFRDIHVIMAPLTSGASIAAKVKLDKASSWTTLKTPSGASSFSTANATEAVFSFSGEGKILEVGITLTPTSNSSPEVLSIITYLEDNFKEYA